MPGYWNAHSDRESDTDDDNPADRIEDELDDLYETIADLRGRVQQLAADVDAATKWAAAYEREHGPFKPDPPLPVFMIVF